MKTFFVSAISISADVQDLRSASAGSALPLPCRPPWPVGPIIEWYLVSRLIGADPEPPMEHAREIDACRPLAEPPSELHGRSPGRCNREDLALRMQLPVEVVLREYALHAADEHRSLDRFRQHRSAHPLQTCV